MFGRYRAKDRAAAQVALKRLMAAALALAVAGPGSASASGTSIAWLLRPPIVPEQHGVVATRYREQAAEAQTLAAMHLTMVARYRAREGGSPLWPVGQRMEDHCTALVAHYEDAVARYDALAANHATLARDWRETPDRGRRDDREF